MKHLIIILFLSLASCATPQKDFYARKHPKETRKSYSEKRELMLLDQTQLGRNKHFGSKEYQNRLKRTYKKLHKK